jgi:hypothetical protein
VLGYVVQGVTNRCRLSWLPNSALVCEPNAGRRVAGSRPMSTALHKHGAKVHFGDLTPYLTYDVDGWILIL